MHQHMYIIISICFLLGSIFVWQHSVIAENIQLDRLIDIKQYEEMEDAMWNSRRTLSIHAINTLRSQGCLSVNVTYDSHVCASSNIGCLNGISRDRIRVDPICMKYGVGHIDTPESVKGIYMTSYVAGNPTFRQKLIDLINQTELNTVIIDIKEVDGFVNYSIGDKDTFPFQNNIMGNIKDFVDQLHKQDIYVIARIVLFKDKAWVEKYPEDAVKQLDKITVWKDFGGKKYVDPGAQHFWDYLIAIAGQAYELGFDEINADYVRFPSDGKMSEAYYPYSQTYIDSMGAMDGRVHSLNLFMDYFTSTLREKYPTIVLSADVFGMVTSLDDDLTIGQKLEPFLEYFDYVSPMVYPSHYSKGFIPVVGHPDNYPYEVVYKAMTDGVAKSQESNMDSDKLRPWLQDFTCTWCAGYFPYGPDQIRAQIQATYDSDLDSWLLWNAGNRYTKGGLLDN